MSMTNPPQTTKSQSVRVFKSTLDQINWQEHFITVVPGTDTSFTSVIQQAAQTVNQLGASVISLDVFGPDEKHVNGLAAIDQAFNAAPIPVSWIQTHLDNHQELFGVNIWAASNIKLVPITHNGILLGNYFDTPAGRIAKLTRLVAQKTDQPRPQQTQEVFDTIQILLQQINMNFLNVARTWFYNNDILSWYDDFNRVRTAFYQQQSVFDHLVPASTGIGGRNPHNSELLLNALAIDSPNQSITVNALNSPLQCPAPQYGSSFSRAIEINYPAAKRISVSGTASIAPGGESAHRDDIDNQIDLTMRVVEAILESRQMSWKNVAQSIAYLRCADDAPAFTKWRRSHDLMNLPVVVTPNIVCRDDLLFEIELEAFAPRV